MSDATSAQASQSVEVVIKADEILELLREQGEMTVAQIATGVGEPRSSVYRLIATLEDMGFVEPGPRGGHQLGLRLFTLGKLVASRLAIIPLARPAMQGLAARTGESAFLMVRDGPRAVCLERVDGSRVRSLAVDVGARVPLHVGAGPLALLAFAGDEALEHALAEAVEPTGDAAVDPGELRQTVTEVGERGYAISDGDPVPGMAEVGAPVRDAAGEVVAALALSGARESVLGPGTEATVAAVLDAAASVSIP